MQFQGANLYKIAWVRAVREYVLSLHAGRTYHKCKIQNTVSHRDPSQQNPATSLAPATRPPSPPSSVIVITYYFPSQGRRRSFVAGRRAPARVGATAPPPSCIFVAPGVIVVSSRGDGRTGRARIFGRESRRNGCERTGGSVSSTRGRGDGGSREQRRRSWLRQGSWRHWR